MCYLLQYHEMIQKSTTMLFGEWFNYVAVGQGSSGLELKLASLEVSSQYFRFPPTRAENSRPHRVTSNQELSLT